MKREVITLLIAIVVAYFAGLRWELDGAQMLVAGMVAWIVSRTGYYTALALIPRRRRRR